MILSLFNSIKKYQQVVGNPTNKLAVRLKQKDGSEVFIYNGVNNYILQAVLKEGLSGDS